MSNVPAIPVFSSAAVNQGIDLAGAMQRVLESNSYILGREVAQFESEFAGNVGTGHCVSVANGTDALELALRAVGVAPGDRVACVANAGFYSSTAVHLVGAVPQYVDVDEQTLTMSPAALAEVLAGRPAAVIATHLYGQLADIERLAHMCRAAGVALIEDCAQAHGARRGGQPAGSFADIGCFSFYPTKNLGAIGDGGAVVTSAGTLADHVRALRQYGWSRKYEVCRLGGRNSRLDELQAAVLREKLPHLDRQNAQRRAIARRYSEAFAGIDVRLPASVGEDFVAHLYVVRSPRRDELRSHLLECGVATDIHYPIADTRQPAYAGQREAERLPVTDAACASVLTLPCFPGLREDQVAHVIRSFRSFFGRAEISC
jgi:dTDP-3-amino-2,3,6-trideoxy-4-keto-D-glucose/dTDP-3-amino-3,4,6-trideoxy-alpha-D-glucose/dTDP-2,6-dideoxy-D-kanosamine transaminase